MMFYTNTCYIYIYIISSYVFTHESCIFKLFFIFIYRILHMFYTLDGSRVRRFFSDGRTHRTDLVGSVEGCLWGSF